MAKAQPSTTFRVRPAVRADAPAMIQVINSAFAIESFLEGTRIDELRLAEHWNGGEFLVAEDYSGTVVASVYVEIKGDRGYFGMLAVDPSQQGRGLARQMIESAEEHCRTRGCHYMDIYVLSLRPELPPLYRKFGYVEMATEEFKPSRPLKGGVECHAILMSKSLV